MVIDSHTPTFTVPDTCSICNRPPTDGVTVQHSGFLGELLITCPQCGKYELVGLEAMTASVRWEPELRCALSCAARQAAEGGLPLRITSERVAAEFADPHLHSRVSDNLEKLLGEVAKRAKRPHIGVEFSLTNDFTLIDCHSKEEFVWYINWLNNQGLAFRTGAGLTAVQLTLSLEGWNQVQPFPRAGGIPGRCFVAMWFTQETSAAYEQGIEPAVSRAGFRPIRIDRKEHNNEIPDEIIAEIRNSQFMVADFTGQRPGVYYEAGFAMGLGRPVIWCCRNDEIEKIHFDTNHKNHIVWQTPQELQERLYKRIRATILEQG